MKKYFRGKFPVPANDASFKIEATGTEKDAAHSDVLGVTYLAANETF